MTLLYTGESATIDRQILKQPDPRHCPLCEDCFREIGHCEDEACRALNGIVNNDEPCGCLCWRCTHSAMEFCTSTEDHKTCINHRHLEEE